MRFGYRLLGSFGLVMVSACGATATAGTTSSSPTDPATFDTLDTLDTSAPDTSDSSAPDSSPLDTSIAASTAAGEGDSTVASAPNADGGAADATMPGWKVIARIGDTPVVWSSRTHPLHQYPSVVASLAIIDATKLTAALFNGPLIPGAGPWNNGDAVMPAARPSLVVAFNGGFEFKHMAGGYYTEGREVKPLKDLQATLGVRNDGRLVLGVYGRDMTNDGSWRSLRQNLPPVMVDGKITVGQFPGTYWGDNLHHVLVSDRSAVCTMADGRLMYALVGPVDINQLAAALVKLGCRTAIELDMNGSWPHFETYSGFGTAQRGGVLLDGRMKHPGLYLKSSTKDFIALFDPATLPAGTVA